MQRITITIDEQLAQEVDNLVESRGYQGRSEAVRDLVRAGIIHTQARSASADSVGCLIYVFDRDTRDLPKRLAHAYQDNHDLCVTTTRVALDHESALEVSVLKGKTTKVEAFAQHLIAERGVRHGRLVLLPAEIETKRHAHGDGVAHSHDHVKVI